MRCYTQLCKYWDKPSTCKCTDIFIGEDGKCEKFEDYHDSPEWRQVFYTRIFSFQNDQHFKHACRGKKVIIFDREFFIEDNTEHTMVYDAETGLACGPLKIVKEDPTYIDKIRDMAKDYPPLSELKEIF